MCTRDASIVRGYSYRVYYWFNRMGTSITKFAFSIGAGAGSGGLVEIKGGGGTE